MRLLGEDLVLYRDQAGTYGLLDRHCAHRRADLSYGWVEVLRYCAATTTAGCGITPASAWSSPSRRSRIPGSLRTAWRIKAYPVEAKAGLLWAYLGPPPIPLVPTWSLSPGGNGFVQIVLSEVPCNWFQCQENSIDPVHFEWLHSNWTRVLQG